MPALLFPRADQGTTPTHDLADQSPHLKNTTTTLLVLATVFVGLRFAARQRRGIYYGWDDWMIIISLLFCYGAGGINYGMIHHGLGQHASEVSQDNLVMVLKLLVAFECVYCTGVGLIKISLLLMYARIFPTKFFKISAYTLGAITVGWIIAINGVSIFQCRPIRKAWLPWIEGSCTNLKASFIGNAIPNILTDVCILLLPAREVWKLHISPARQVSLWFMFGLGGFVLFASIYRFTTIMQFQPADTTWTLATACTWCVVEVASGVISACLPTLRPLLKLISNQFGDSSRGTSNGPKGTTGNNSRRTDLVTIGGTGGKRSKMGTDNFSRIDDDGMEMTLSGSRGESDKSIRGNGGRTGSDEMPLTNITITKDMSWQENKASGSTSGAK